MMPVIMGRYPREPYRGWPITLCYGRRAEPVSFLQVDIAWAQVLTSVYGQEVSLTVPSVGELGFQWKVGNFVESGAMA
jgi:hypothetical protein